MKKDGEIYADDRLLYKTASSSRRGYLKRGELFALHLRHASRNEFGMSFVFYALEVSWVPVSPW